MSQNRGAQNDVKNVKDPAAFWGTRPQKVYVERQALDFPRTQKILGRLAGIPTEVIDSPNPLLAEIRKKRDPLGEGKRVLLLARDQGRSFKPFPEV